MLHIKLRDRQDPPANDTMNRSWIGYDPTVPNEELFANNRGRWKLGPRAEREDYVLFSHEGTVKFVAEIHGLVQDTTPGRRIIEGRVLDASEPLAARWISSPAPDGNRNPISYYYDPDAGPATCACGCGGAVSTSRSFLPGHDQRAVRDRVDDGWGSTVKFIDWFDQHRDEIVARRAR